MASQSTRSITLTPEQSKSVDQCIASGRLKSADEVFSEGLRLLELEEAEYQAALVKTRDLISENPRIGRRRKDLSKKDRPLRSLPILGRFLIIYEVKEGFVIIQRILDGTRDLKRIFE